MNRVGNRLTLLFLAACLPLAAHAAPASAPAHGKPDARATRVIEHWTPARRAAAIPRDLVRDARGRGYLRLPDGALVAHGHNAGQLWSSDPVPMAKPGGGGTGDSTPPSISNLSPAAGSTIGASAAFSATVTDASGVRSVAFEVGRTGAAPQSFAASSANGTTWTTTLQGFTDGSWQWRVVAKDKAAGGGNTATSGYASFTVDTSGGGGGGGGGGGDVVTNAPWTTPGVVQTAAGRIYFEMPSNSRRTRWAGYVCSGTVATDSTGARSIIITAAHCVFDDAYKAFARNVLFIPNQDETSGSGTDLNCSNDPLGCWSPTFGVVDINWTTRTFPDNVAWDYAYYVVNDSGAHTGTAASSSVLDVAAQSLPISFAIPSVGQSTRALGYSYSEDPNFMYCAENMGTMDAVNWWLGSCGLSGGASGGLWQQPGLDTNPDAIMSVNSWGYTTGPGMAGPKLSGTSAECVFGMAKATNFSSVPSTAGDAGVKVSACP